MSTKRFLIHLMNWPMKMSFLLYSIDIVGVREELKEGMGFFSSSID